MSTARTRANNKYNKKTYDVLAIRLKKGIRDEWKKAAEERNLSLAQMITNAVNAYLQEP